MPTKKSEEILKIDQQYLRVGNFLINKIFNTDLLLVSKSIQHKLSSAESLKNFEITLARFACTNQKLSIIIRINFLHLFHFFWLVKNKIQIRHHQRQNEIQRGEHEPTLANAQSMDVEEDDENTAGNLSQGFNFSLPSIQEYKNAHSTNFFGSTQGFCVSTQNNWISSANNLSILNESESELLNSGRMEFFDQHDKCDSNSRAKTTKKEISEKRFIEFKHVSLNDSLISAKSDQTHFLTQCGTFVEFQHPSKKAKLDETVEDTDNSSFALVSIASADKTLPRRREFMKIGLPKTQKFKKHLHENFINEKKVEK